MTSQELIAALKALGLSNRSIGQVLGRNDSLISQIHRGKKPGRNLQEPLTRLLELVQAGEHRKDTLKEQTPAPTRRTRKSGQAARVRGAKHIAAGFTESVGEHAARKGARSLARRVRDARDAGLQVAWTLTFKPPRQRRGGGAGGGGVSAEGNSSRRRGHKSGRGAPSGLPPRMARNWCEFMTPNLDALLSDIQDAGGNVTRAIVAEAEDRGLISYPPNVDPTSQILAIEVRAW